MNRPGAGPADPLTAWLDAAARQPLLTPAEEVHLSGLVRAWQDHHAGPADAPPAIRRRGLRARDRFVAGNLRLVHLVVVRRNGHGSIEDRLQAGAIGLIRAAERFDAARGYKFSTYAYFWIRQSVNLEILGSGTIRVPLNVAAALAGQKDGKVAAWQLEAGAAARAVTSLDLQVLDDDGGTIADAIPGDRLEVEQLEHQAAAAAAIDAMRAADPDGAALLELAAEGHKVSSLAGLAQATAPATVKRMKATATRLRALPEVRDFLASA